MDFYYGDRVRSTFGFENPNHAAAFIATLLPIILGCLVACLRLRLPWRRYSGAAIVLVVLTGGWWCLFQTLSRGGIVAAVVGSGYVVYRTQLWRGRASRLIAAWAASIVLLSFFSPLSSRMAQSLTGDRAITNRMELWEGGLIMLASNPGGVGAGNSGEMYTRWFQPEGMTARYRTMVNSYLTFAVERGLFLAAAAVFGASIFWGVTSITPSALSLGLRGALLAWGVAAAFSTTLENKPILAAGALLALLLLLAQRNNLQGLIGFSIYRQSLIISFGITACLFAAGKMLASKGEVTVRVQPAQQITITPHGAGRVLTMIHDDSVLMEYGKPLRQLAARANAEIRLSDRVNGSEAAVIIFGSRVKTAPPAAKTRLVLVAPAMMGESEARELLATSERVAMLLPEIDEDGRVEFWSKLVEAKPEKVTIITLHGVGTCIDQASEQMVREIAEFLVVR